MPLRIKKIRKKTQQVPQSGLTFYIFFVSVRNLAYHLIAREQCTFFNHSLICVSLLTRKFQLITLANKWWKVWYTQFYTMLPPLCVITSPVTQFYILWTLIVLQHFLGKPIDLQHYRFKLNDICPFTRFVLAQVFKGLCQCISTLSYLIKCIRRYLGISKLSA